MAKIEINKLDESDDYQVSEAYKRLRTNLQLCGLDRCVLVATSCFLNEGKSTTTLYLAISLAEMGKKVFFIDADLRKSVLAGRFHLRNAVSGLSHYLSGMETFKDVVNDTTVSGLHMILAGPIMPNPSEMLSGDAFKILVNYARNVYDYGIQDSCIYILSHIFYVLCSQKMALFL